MARNEASYDDLQTLFVNCTLKRSPERSHQALRHERSV